jgi:Zn-dependent M28 family amino/carboxypeptidase
VVIVHETEPAAYGWSVVQSSWGSEQFTLANPDRNMGRVPVQSWISLEKAREVFKAGGQDYDALKAAALKKDFQPVPLKVKASFKVENTMRQVQSRNVVAKLEGSDEKLKSEFVIYTAHWDHLGRDTTLEGDQILNGADDNGTGVAGLLEIAQAFLTLKVKPKRSVLFLAVTAEEKGLLGSQFYAENPLYPIARTVATLNMDMLGTWGPARDVQVVGAGQNTLEDDFAVFATRQGRIVVADGEPQKGSYFRSDQFNFAKQGVPSLYTKSGVDTIGKPGFGEAKRAEFTARDYHKVTDEVKPDWDLSGAVQDVQLLFEVGEQVADSDHWPTWKQGSEFKAKRETVPPR